MTISPQWYVILSALLMCIGVAGVMIRRNTLVVLLSVEIMLNASNLALIAFSRLHADDPGGGVDGQIMALVAMAIAASEVVVGLGMVVAMSHLHRELDTDQMRELRG